MLIEFIKLVTLIESIPNCTSVLPSVIVKGVVIEFPVVITCCKFISGYLCSQTAAPIVESVQI